MKRVSLITQCSRYVYTTIYMTLMVCVKCSSVGRYLMHMKNIVSSLSSCILRSKLRKSEQAFNACSDLCNLLT